MPLLHKDFSWPCFSLGSFSYLQKVDPKIVIKKILKNQFFNSLPSTYCCKSCSQQILNRLSFPICHCVLFRQLWHFYLYPLCLGNERLYLPIIQSLYVHKNQAIHKFPTPLCAPKFAVKAHYLKSNVI